MKHYSDHKVNTNKVSVVRINNMSAILKRKTLAHKLRKAVNTAGTFYMTFQEMSKLFGKPLLGRDLSHVELLADKLGITVFYDEKQQEYGIIEDDNSVAN